MNTWIIVLSAIGGIVVGWVTSRWWQQSCYQPVVDQLYKQNVEMQQQLEILENIQHLKSTNLSQKPPSHNEIETDNSNKGYQEWVEEHQTDEEEKFAANYAEENKQQLYETAGAYWNKLTINQRIDQLKEWGIPQAFLPINIEWKSVPENIQIDWVTNYTEHNDNQTDEEFLNEMYSPTWKRPPEIADVEYWKGIKYSKEECEKYGVQYPEVSVDHLIQLQKQGGLS